MAKRIIVVEGLPGSGRTTIVAEYLKQHDDEFADATVIDIDTYLKYGSVSKTQIQRAQTKMLRECNRHVAAETDWIVIKTIVNWLDKDLEKIASDSEYNYSKEIILTNSASTETMSKRSSKNVSAKEIENIKSIRA